MVKRFIPNLLLLLGMVSILAASGKKPGVVQVNKKMVFPIDDRVHRVHSENGGWRVCGD